MVVAMGVLMPFCVPTRPLNMAEIMEKMMVLTKKKKKKHGKEHELFNFNMKHGLRVHDPCCKIMMYTLLNSRNRT